MTELRDPLEIYRESLANIPAPQEEQPPQIARFEVWPYPDLHRLWVRIELTPFAASPNLSLALIDADGALVSQMFLVEVRQPYQSLTMHLRREPRAGERYRLLIDLERDDVPLDRRELEFDLIYAEPGERAGDARG